MLTNTADGIVKWIKENNGCLTLQFRNRGTICSNGMLCDNLTIFFQEEVNKFLFEIAEFQENNFKIYNRQVIFNGHTILFKNFSDDDLYLNKTIDTVNEKDLEKFIKFYTNKIKCAKKLYKENLIKNICKEDVDA